MLFAAITDVIETVGYVLVGAFLYFVWPPLVLLGAGLLLIAYVYRRPDSEAPAVPPELQAGD